MVSEPGLSDPLADRIADAVFQVYETDKILAQNKAAKPVTRTNGVEEWTVLASILMIQDNQVKPLTLTTGVKCMPDEALRNSRGRIVHDMHAEILSLRALQKFIIEDMDSQRVLEKTQKGFKVKDGIEFALYISELPCGDASIKEAERWEYGFGIVDGKSKRIKLSESVLLRGRSDVSDLGKVRTKPGRGDSLVSLSKSCSDKLVKIQKVGLFNGVLSQIVSQKHLKYLVLPEVPGSSEGITRCFTRLEGKRMTILTTSRDFVHCRKDGKLPCNISMLYLVDQQLELLCKGIKNGTKGISDKNSSMVSRYNLTKAIEKHLSREKLELATKSYYQLKKDGDRYEQAEKSKADLGNWVPTYRDDFAL
ncbi:BA75_05094T0 [Komagataella pastoris]|uniref:BA75_05094T0 n=1 Tax=Komagataella pastoris TaxID=4922 RepID=A0A1B2JJA7_PICPA|nr:BA75_05094T0 [Komagataella pastoris]